MPAYVEYSFDYIAPGGNASVYIHGYSNREAVNYSAVVYALQGDAYYPWGAANMSQGEAYRHVDNTVARKVYVKNLAPFNPCAVDILANLESF
jgi:hypothetical protein